MNKILVIGCGGIGSFFIRELFQLYENSVKGTDVLIDMVDDDIVEEKNLRYQNFKIEDLEEKKAIALSSRYPFNPKIEKIENEEQLKEYDTIILAVDNGKTRELVYKYCENKNTYFIDLRSEGRGIAYYTKNKKNSLDYLLSTINPEAPSTSCQLKFELEEGKIQIGNRIIAMIGVQLLLNHLREEKNPANFVQRF